MTIKKILLVACIVTIFVIAGCSKAINPELLYIDPNRHFVAVYPKGWLPDASIRTNKTSVEFRRPGAQSKPYIYLGADSTGRQRVVDDSKRNHYQRTLRTFQCRAQDRAPLMTKTDIEFRETDIIKNLETRNLEQWISFNHMGVRYGVGMVARKEMFNRDYKIFQTFIDNIILLEASLKCSDTEIKAGIVSTY